MDQSQTDQRYQLHHKSASSLPLAEWVPTLPTAARRSVRALPRRFRLHSWLAGLAGTVALRLACLGGPHVARAHSLPLDVAWPDIPLPGKPNRFDYEAIDPERRLLFIAHLGSGQVTVVNLDTDGVVANIHGVPRVHGVLAVPSLGETFASATGQNRIDVISENTFTIVASAPAGYYPDGMAYAPPEHEVFISDELGRTETVFDTATNRRVATFPMGGEVGNSQYDPATGLILADVQTRDQIVAIDPHTNRIVHRYTLPAACHNDHSLLLDAPARLGFVACDGNAKLLLLSLKAMKTLSIHRTGRNPDVLAFDPGLRRLYVASESGVIAVFHLDGDTLKLLGRAFLAPHAHSVAVDPRTHKVYFPLQDISGQGVLRVMKPIKDTRKPR